jgi:hypothetical protein
MGDVIININSETDAVNSEGRHLVPRGAEKVGLLSSILLQDSFSQELYDGFATGFGSIFELEDDASYDASAIKRKHDKLVGAQKKCTIIATAGGSVSLEALRLTAAVPFVSLVGYVPSNLPSKCKGGVSLESYNQNRARLAYLVGRGHTPGHIVLLTNANSTMHGLEQTDWSSTGGVFEESYVGTAGTNDVNGFGWDFNGRAAAGGLPALPGQIDANVTAIIISGDPFFQANRAVLIPLINTWLAIDPAHRDVVYPSTSYLSARDSSGNVVTPTGRVGGKTCSTIIGPDLKQAYQLLGVLASYVANNKNIAPFGFFPIASNTTPVL